MRRAALTAILLTALASPVATRAAASPDVVPTATLALGQSAFWDGGYVADANVPSADACDMAGPCFSYDLRVTAPGQVLRVGLDTPSREDSFELIVQGPEGNRASAGNDNQFNAEAFAYEPKAGMWRVQVIPKGATKASFRMRAKLEAAPPARDPKAVLLPNLRSVPPYEFGFTAPANPFNGVYPPDTVNPPLDVAGYHPASCAADEGAEDGVSRCLRLTAGPMNAGDGPFEMHFTHISDVQAGAEPRMFQWLRRADGSHTVRDGGTYSFHKTHAHYHYDDILTYELFEVTDAETGTIAKSGVGHKSGFCPADQLFADWREFRQARAGAFGEGDSAGGNCFSPTDGLLGLSTGWGDIYRWQRPGQYVDFGSNGDGLYVVRTTVDKDGHVLESDDTDNASFALIRVTGDAVAILERGRGAGPWDPAKVVYRGAGPSAIS